MRVERYSRGTLDPRLRKLHPQAGLAIIVHAFSITGRVGRLIPGSRVSSFMNQHRYRDR
jgi:hypothetical protein